MCVRLLFALGHRYCRRAILGVARNVVAAVGERVGAGAAVALGSFANPVASPCSRPGKGRGRLEVAGPGLEGGQVAVLRPLAVVC